MIKKAAVIGAGTMGHGLALVLAKSGIEVKIYARTTVPAALEKIRERVGFLEEMGMVDDGEGVLRRIQGASTIAEAVTDADYVIEAVSEDVSVKKKVYAEVEAHCRGILASTTSQFIPSVLADGLLRPEKFIVAHFWNPPYVIPLVEVVPGPKTLPEVTKVTEQLIERLGLAPVTMKKEIPGFIGNRLQYALFHEALSIVESGAASPEDVDRAVKLSLGPRWAQIGPIETADLGGLDIFRAIGTNLGPTYESPLTVPRILEEKVKAGKLGAKSGSGFYEWTPERLKATIDRRDRSIIEHFARNEF